MEYGINRDFLLKLLSQIGPSGNERNASRLWQEEAKKFAKVYTDTHGNAYAEVGKGSPILMLAGHIDEIGLMVRYVDENGFVYLAPVGGWDPQVLVGQRVRFLTKDGDVLKGVVGRKPIHVLRPEERERAVKIEELFVDFGLSKDEILKRLDIGAYGVLDWDGEMLTQERLVSRALDDRIGAFVVLEALRMYAKEPADTRMVAVATVQEEIGLRGARTSAFAVNPDIAIAVDVTVSTDYPGVPKHQIGDIALGKGPVLAIGPNINPVIFNLLREIAEDEGIDVQIEAISRGTPTDANLIQITREGIPTALISIPCRYLHSPSETVDLRDVESAVRLIVAFARRVSGIRKEDFKPW
ncbi:MAG: M42 family metallopeptidase [Thermotogae bacterium]|nr:M42 family metallopeptidase [Thermotogota bacterium]